MNDWTMTMNGRELSPAEVEIVHIALVALRSATANGDTMAVSYEDVRALVHEMTFGGDR